MKVASSQGDNRYSGMHLRIRRECNGHLKPFASSFQRKIAARVNDSYSVTGTCTRVNDEIALTNLREFRMRFASH